MTRIVLVDDHALFRRGVRAELAELADRVEVVGEAGSVGEAIAVIRQTRPEVVLLDVHLPDGGGQAVVAAVRDEVPETRFLALSVSDAPDDVVAVIRAGARGYVTKSIAPGELADAVRRIADGDVVFSPRLAGFVLDAFRAGAAPDPAGRAAATPTADGGAGGTSDEDLDVLTARERDVLRLLARGYTYREIAKELYISVKTVETHASNVLRKLQLSNRHQLTRWAADRRLT